MTLFLEILRPFSTVALANLITALSNQTQSSFNFVSFLGVGYNSNLSNQQQAIVTDLSVKMSSFKDMEDDSLNSAALIDLIAKTVIELQSKRVSKGKKETGKTTDALNQLQTRIRMFYQKLKEFDHEFKGSFNLINRNAEPENQKTPEGIFYYHVVRYLALNIFLPPERYEVKIRNQKEEALRSAIITISERIKPKHSRAERARRVQEALANLNLQNREISESGGLNKMIPNVVPVPNTPVAFNVASSGISLSHRIEELIKKTREDIKNLPEEKHQSSSKRSAPRSSSPEPTPPVSPRSKHFSPPPTPPDSPKGSASEEEEFVEEEVEGTASHSM